MSLSNSGSALDMLDWKVREELMQVVIDFCIIVRFSTPKQSILHYVDIGSVFAFDKKMMTALDGNVEEGEACLMLVPPVSSLPKNGSDLAVASLVILAPPITKAVVIPLQL